MESLRRDGLRPGFARRVRTALGTAVAGARRRTLVSGAIGTLALQAGGLALAFVTGVLLARMLGPAGYGSYAFAMAWISVLAIPAALGSDRLVVREVAAYRAQSAWGMFSGFRQWMTRSVVLASVGLALSSALAFAVLADRPLSQDFRVLGVALFLLPLLSLTTVRDATVQGLNHVVAGQLPEGLVRQAVFLMLLMGCAAYAGGRLSPAMAMGASVAAAALALLVAVYLESRLMPLEAKKAHAGYGRRTWLQAACVMVLISGAMGLGAHVNQILLGILAGSEAVGLYSVADRGAAFVLLPMVVATIVLRPAIASLYAAGNRGRLQLVLTKSARLIVLASLPVAICFIAFGDWFLLLFFGQSFTGAQTALSILSIGQLGNAATGPVTVLLLMTGHERAVASTVALGTLANLGLDLVLIPRWGVEGAAVARAVSLMGWNVAQVILARRRLHIDSTLLGNLRQHA